MFFNRKIDYTYLIEKHLDKDFIICCNADNSPTKAEIKEFEDEIKFKLPDEFKNFSTSYLGGMYVEVKEDLWEKSKQFNMNEPWLSMNGFSIYGFSSDIPECMNIKLKYKEFITELELNCVPFMKLHGSSNVYCFGKGKKIYLWNTETQRLEKSNKTFIGLLEYEMNELRDRKNTKLSRNKAL